MNSGFPLIHLALVMGLTILSLSSAQQASVNKLFSPASINPGDTTKLTIRIFNARNIPLTNVRISDDLGAASLRAVLPLNITGNTCGGTVSDTSGSGTVVRLSGGSVAAATTVPSQCEFSVDVTSTVSGNRVNTIPVGALQTNEGVSNVEATSATLNVAPQNAIGVSKVGTTTLPVGGRAPLTIIVSNNNPYSQTGLTFTDTFPAGLVLGNSPGGGPIQSNSCGGTLTDGGGGSVGSGDMALRLSGGVVPANSDCSLVFWVTAATAGSYTNSLAAGSVTTARGSSNVSATSATLNFQVSQVAVGKLFAPTRINPGDTAKLTIRIFNSKNTPLTNVGISDDLGAASLRAVLPLNVTGNTCGGTVSDSSGSGTLIRLSGGSVPAATTFPGQCEFSVDVTSTIPGNRVNTIPASALQTNEGVTNLESATATLNVGAQDSISVTKVGSTTLPVGGRAPFTVIISNPNTYSETGLAFTDTFPAGLILTAGPTGSPVQSNSCGGTLTDGGGGSVDSGDTVLRLSGGVVPANADCSLVFWATAATAGSYTNSLAAGSVTTSRGSANVSATSATLTFRDVLSVFKSFSPPVTHNEANSTVNINLLNPRTVGATGVTLTDNLPAGLTIANPSGASNGCGGTLTATPGTSVVRLTGGTIPARFNNASGATVFGSCSIVVQVKVSVRPNPAPGSPVTLTNTIAVGGLTSTNLGNNPDPASATLQIVHNPTVDPGPPRAIVDTDVGFGTSAQSDATIVIGSSTTLYVRLFNAYFNQNLTNARIVIPLPTNAVIANIPNARVISGDGANFPPPCGGSVVAVPGASSLTWSGFTIPQREYLGCYLRVDVQGRALGPQTFSLPFASLTTTEGATNNWLNQSGTLTVISPASIAKRFDPNAMQVGGKSRAVISITNKATFDLTGAALTDTLPAGLIVADPPNVVNTCSGVVSATPGNNSLSISGSTVPGQFGGVDGICSVSLEVTNGSSITGPTVLTNTIPAAALTNQQNISNTLPASADLRIALIDLEVFKEFLQAQIGGGGPNFSRMRITIRNAANVPVSGLRFTDYMPPGMILTSAPNPSTTCRGGAVAATPGADSFTFSGGDLSGGQQCLVEINVTAVAGTNLVNIIPTGGVTSRNGATNLNPTSATLTRLPKAAVTKGFTPGTIGAGNTSLLTISVLNGTINDFTGVRVLDSLPSGLSLASPANLSTTCTGGTVQGVAGGSEVLLTGATVAANSACVIMAQVTSAVTGTYINTIPPANATTHQGGLDTSEATATLLVTAPPAVAKTFAPSTMPLGAHSRLTLTLSNPTANPLTNAILTDSMPLGLRIANDPRAATTCGGTLTAIEGSTSVSLSAGTIPANGNCTVQVYVSAEKSGTYTNTVPAGALVTAAGSNVVPASANLSVVEPPSVVKGFAPDYLSSTTQTSRLTITMRNANAVALSDLSITDVFPSGLTLAAPSNPATTCGGLIDISTPTQISLIGGSIPDSGSCTLAVDVRAGANGNYLNRINAGNVTTSNGGYNRVEATATLDVGLPSIGGMVYVDANRNSLRDGGEVGLGGVTLQLLNSAGNPVLDASNNPITTLSLPDGLYRFAGPQVVAGSSYRVRQIQPAAYGSSQNPSNEIGIASLPSTGSRDNSFGETLAEVSGRVFRDDAHNGTFEGSDVGLPTTLTLTGLSYGPDGVAGGGDDSHINIARQTNADGTYSFDGLFPGIYTLNETEPSGYWNGITTAGSAGGSASALLTTPSTISGISLTAGQQSVGNNFAEIMASSISATVWRDDNNDGAIGGGEPSIPNALVRLQGNNDLGQTVDAYLLTDASGLVRFENLRPGIYRLTQTTPSGYLDGKEKNGTPAGTMANDAIGNIVLLSGTNASGYAFGEGLPSGLSGTAYRDLNNDGVQSGAGETGIAGVSITLSGKDHQDNAICYRAVSNASGLYSFVAGAAVVDCTNPTSPITINSFAGLPPSDANGYTLTETQPAGFSSTIANAPGTVGGTPTGTAPNPNVFVGVVIALPSSTAVGYNFGELPQSGVSGAVYVDKDQNGSFGAGDLPIAGVAIRLQGSDSDGNSVDLSTTTETDGSYTFPTVKPGSYTITQTQPSGYANGLEAPSNVRGIAVADFVAGSVTGQNFGEVVGSIVGLVYRDLNNDGLSGAGETGIPGVTVRLSGTDLNGNPVNRTAQTDADGRYRFDDVLPANATGYTVTETQPGGFSDARANPPGSAGGTASGPNSYTGITPAAGQQATGYNFGELPTATLSGNIWQDTNGNATRDRLEGPLPAGVGPVMVQVRNPSLQGARASASEIRLEIQPDAAGNYSFPNLPPGTYTLGIASPPPGYRLTTGNATQSIILNPGETVVATAMGFQPQGTLSGRVFRDENGNALQDEGEGVYADTPVTITDAFGGVQTVMTDAGGNYSATVAAGLVSANVSDPAGTRLTTSNDPQQALVVVNTNTPTTPVGFQPLEGDVYGRVFEDKNNNRQYDTGEGLLGVVVRITDPVKKNPDGSATVHQVKTNLEGRYDTRIPDPADPGKPALKVSIGEASVQVVETTLPSPSGWHQTVGTNPSSVTVQTALSVNAGDDGFVRARLNISKVALQPVVEVGSSVGWRISLSNAGAVEVHSLEIVDTLPLGLTYKAGSSKLGNLPLADPIISAVNGRQRLSWKLSGSLLPGQSVQLEMVSVVGVVAPGKLENIAIANGSVGIGNTITTITTGSTSAIVEVRRGVFDDESVLVGRVYLDHNRNNSYEEGRDEGIAGARVYLSDGRYAVTDQQGRYSLPEVEAGLYALRLDPLTVPYLPKPVPDDQGMPGTRYGRTPLGGGVVGEDFPLYPVEGTATKLRSTVVKRGPVQLEKSAVQVGSRYAITVELKLTQPVSGLYLTDPLPTTAQRSELVLIDTSGKRLELKAQADRLLLPTHLEAGSYTLRYTLSTDLPLDQVITDPDIHWEVK